MSLAKGEGYVFLEQVWPLLECRDTERLTAFVSRAWPPARLAGLLKCGDATCVQAALVCLALTGTMAESAAVARLLHAADAATADLAEQTLWSIWFRAGDDLANALLDRAVQLLGRDEGVAAIEWLSILAMRRPDFAEVYNQRASARFLAGQYEPAMTDARTGLRLNPLHFGAMATLGHCQAVRGDLAGAMATYEAALRVHPRLPGLRETVDRVAACLARRGGRDGPAPPQ